MNYVGKLFSNVKGFYNEINSATLTGAIDVVIVKQEDGSYISSPWHVRFGKMGVLRAREKLVDIEINGEPVDLHMKLGEGGAAFFVQEAEEAAEVPAHLATSPLPSTLELMEQGLEQLRQAEEDEDATTPTNNTRLTANASCSALSAFEPAPSAVVLKRIKSASDMATQTEMTGNEVESKAARPRGSMERLPEGKVKRRRKRRPVNRKEPAGGGEAMFVLEMSSEEEETGGAEPGGSELPTLQLARTDAWANHHFHPFSDGELTPIVSPVCSRPPSPKSDTEYETQMYDAHAQTRLTGDDMTVVDDVQWAWGELPTTSPHPLPSAAPEEVGGGGLLSFMRKTRKARHQPEQEGIYLDDLNLEQMDPEVAALYLYRGHHRKDEDAESGRGASLPQSPIPGVPDTHPPPQPPLVSSGVALSLCGGLKHSADISEEKFLEGLVTYDQFCADPSSIIGNPDLVVRMGDKYYPWQVAGSMMLSQFVFQQPLSEGAVDHLLKQHMPKKEKRRGWGLWGWRGAAEEAPPPKKEDGASQTSPPTSLPGSPAKTSPLRQEKPVESTDETDSESSDKGGAPIKIKVETTQPSTQPPAPPKREKFKKSLKLSSADIMKLNLQEGMNEVTFSVTTQYQGTCRCNCYVYVWNWDDRIIISDIDGTITKSDVLGQVLPMIGKDWSQEGIAHLYNMVYRNGYKFVYLSARAIGQSRITREYLRSVRQGELSLPDGPLLLSPSSLISAFHKEVIERKPEEFKISCLKDIAALFPESSNPFYSGFGNKINDVWAYQAVGIPISRVFTVNHRGELRMELHSSYQSSYSKMTDVVDHFFPPLLDKVPQQGPTKSKMLSGNFPAAQEFSTFTYWREPLPDISDELAAFSKGSKSSSAASKRRPSLDPAAPPTVATEAEK